MRMFGTGINFQFGHLLTAQRIAGNHTFNSFFDNSFRETAGQNFCRSRFFNTANPAGMFEIFLVSQFTAGELDFVGIDDNDIVAAVKVRNVAGFVFAAQNLGDFGRQTTQYDTFGVNDIPFL